MTNTLTSTHEHEDEAEEFADDVAHVIKAALIPILERIAALETRPAVKYAGTWTKGQTYNEGSLATHQGGLWLAESLTTYAPGIAGSGWRLVVKSRRA